MIELSGPALTKFDSESVVAKDLNAITPSLAKKDSTLWGTTAEAEARIRLNWIDLPKSSRDLLPQLDAISAWVRSSNLAHFILCGMGGSSLAPEVIAKTFGKKLTVLDSTDPMQIRLAIPADLSQALVIVGSKSGSTIETASQKSFFEKLFTDANLDPKDHFVIVTDPNSPLDKSARASGLRVVNADPNVGGRFSALSAFGLVPAAILGVDVSVLLDDAEIAAQTFTEPNSSAVKIATLIFQETEQNFSLLDGGSNVPGIGDWIEQLVAESTGKEQKGRLPIVVGSENSKVSGPALSIGFAKGDCDLNVSASLGEHFILWEWVTALICRALEVDPFNQPNVTEAKERTGKLLEAWGAQGRVDAEPSFESDSYAIYGGAFGSQLSQVLKDLVDASGKYLAIMAYLNREQDFEITRLRDSIAEKSGVGVTFGWGPRFLHSTGQFHKGGAHNGAFLQITSDCETDIADIAIPGKDFSFQDLLMAQALGDGQALLARDLPVIRIHLKNRAAGIAEILKAAEKL
jgi:glucose-6-phosphate isomerase